MGHLDCTVLPNSLPTILLLSTCLFGLSLGTELGFVTCGSVLKLLNTKHNVRLHSHDVRYGSGEFPLIKRPLSITKLTVVHVCNSKDWFIFTKVNSVSDI